MKCPFLRKMNVKFCGLCRSTKIPLGAGEGSSERCTGPGYRECPLILDHPETDTTAEQCPQLSVGDVYYCTLAPGQKPIPCNLTALSRCTGDGHRYCQTFLDMTGAGGKPQDEATEEGAATPEAGLPVPPGLAFSPNHMWLDMGEGQTCHVGVDAFFARVMGQVDEIVFPHSAHSRLPMVRFRSGGVDLEMVFPHPLQAYEVNSHLVADPSAAVNDPYGSGWLFEGAVLPGTAPTQPHPLEKGLLRDDQARQWMRTECDRLDRFCHDRLITHSHDGQVLVQDGGRPADLVLRDLDRAAMVRLHEEFFRLHPGRTE